MYNQLSSIVNSQIDEYETSLERLRQKKDNSVINNETYTDEVYIINNL